MATTKISITVDVKRLEELKKLADAGISLSAIVDEALHRELKRQQMIALLAEMERTNPITDEERAKGEKIWKQLKSSSIPEPSQPSRKKPARSARPSRKR